MEKNKEKIIFENSYIDNYVSDSESESENTLPYYNDYPCTIEEEYDELFNKYSTKYYIKYKIKYLNSKRMYNYNLDEVLTIITKDKREYKIFFEIAIISEKIRHLISNIVSTSDSTLNNKEIFLPNINWNDLDLVFLYLKKYYLSKNYKLYNNNRILKLSCSQYYSLLYSSSYLNIKSLFNFLISSLGKYFECKKNNEILKFVRLLDIGEFTFDIFTVLDSSIICSLIENIYSSIKRTELIDIVLQLHNPNQKLTLPERKKLYKNKKKSNINKEIKKIKRVADNFFNYYKNKIKNIVTGNGHIFILTNNGNVYVMGKNNYGQLGTGNNTNINIPVLLTTNIKKIACGNFHTLLLTNYNQVYSCGANRYGQLGIGNNNNQNTLNNIKINNIKDIICGNEYSILLTYNGKVSVFGRNDNGQLGLNDYNSRNLPQYLFFNDIKQVACGEYHTLLLSEDDYVYVFGLNNNKQLGIENKKNIKFPTKLSFKDVKQVSCGYNYSHILLNNGQVHLLSNDKLDNKFHLDNVISISNGINHTIILTNDDRIICLGDNTYKQLGEYYTDNLFNLLDIENVKNIYCNMNYTLIFTDDGNIISNGKILFNKQYIEIQALIEYSQEYIYSLNNKNNDKTKILDNFDKLRQSII